MSGWKLSGALLLRVISAMGGLLTLTYAGRRSTFALPWCEQACDWELFGLSKGFLDTSDDLKEDNETQGRIDRTHRQVRLVWLACGRKTQKPKRIVWQLAVS